MTTTNELKDLIGDPRQADADLRAFSRTARKLTSQRPRMIKRYPRRWVALQAGKVRADSGTLKDVLRQLDERGIPRKGTIVRFINTEPTTMIL